jgi:hypothetical protein
MQSAIVAPAGTSKRDYFALVTLQTLIASPVSLDKNYAAQTAVDMADLLISALSKPPKKEAVHSFPIPL